MKKLLFFVGLLAVSSLLLTSCAKEEAIEETMMTSTPVETFVVEIPRGISEEEAQEWLDGLSYDEAVSLSVESSPVASRWCGNWSSWSTYHVVANCYGCAGNAFARHTLYQRRTRVCCNSGFCYGSTQYRRTSVCRSYC